MEEIILAVQILGLAGLAFWIEALRRAVKAQRETIAAQSEMLSSVQRFTEAARNVLESLDEPKMLARVKAYKEFVELEKEAALKAQAEQFTNAKSQLTKGSLDAIDLLFKDTAGYVDLTAKLILFVPTRLRAGYIQALNISDWHKDRLLELAKAAPDISTIEGRLAAVGTEGLAGKAERLLQALLPDLPEFPSLESKGFMTDKPTDVSGGSAIYGQQIDVPNKREMLSGILQELESEGAIDPGWTTTKMPTDIEHRCTFQHQTGRQVTGAIENMWFRDEGGREKIKALLRRDLGVQKP